MTYPILVKEMLDTAIGLETIQKSELGWKECAEKPADSVQILGMVSDRANFEHAYHTFHMKGDKK